MAGAVEQPRRERRWPRWLLWAVAVLACLGGFSTVVKSATFPRAVAQHPVRVKATVTDSYINGFGGDPGVDYEYRVGGRLYAGSGNGKLGGEPMPLQRGGKVAIEYAADAPAESCTCDAVHAPPSLRSAILIAAVLTLPLVVLLWRRVPRWVGTRHSWFSPPDSVGGWIGLLLGLLVAIPVGALVLAYFFAPSVYP